MVGDCVRSEFKRIKGSVRYSGGKEQSAGKWRGLKVSSDGQAEWEVTSMAL